MSDLYDAFVAELARPLTSHLLAILFLFSPKEPDKAQNPKFECARNECAIVGPWAGANAVASGPRHYLEADDCLGSTDRPEPTPFVRPLLDVWLRLPGPGWAISI